MEKEARFIGVRMDDQCIVFRSTSRAFSIEKKLDPRYDLINHSPDGFEWGYSGSGPAQLALAICASVLNNDSLALSVYQEFKDTVIADIKTSSWTLPESKVKEYINAILTKRQTAVVNHGTRI